MVETATEVELHLAGHLRNQEIFNRPREESTTAGRKWLFLFPSVCQIHYASDG